MILIYYNKWEIRRGKYQRKFIQILEDVWKCLDVQVEVCYRGRVFMENF